MKITDEEIERDLKTCERAIHWKGTWGDFPFTARTRWPLYINELKKLREELKIYERTIKANEQDLDALFIKNHELEEKLKKYA